jgi:hypothetical protein
MLFAAEAFGVKKNFLNKYIILSVITAVLLALPNNYYGVKSSIVATKTDNIRPYTSVLLVVVSILIYARIAHASFSTADKASESIPKAGFHLIGYSQVCMIIFFVFLMLDTLYISITNGSGYTFFTYLAWVFCTIFFITCYLGFIMPDWLKNRLQKK